MIGAPVMIDGAPMTTDVLPSCEGDWGLLLPYLHGEVILAAEFG
jgi:hypothetical protein